eukprot:15327091-Ditylum_brightwellii.AAC.1
MEVVELLKAIRGCIVESNHDKKNSLSLLRAEGKIHTLKQTHDMTKVDFYKKFNSLVPVVGLFEEHPGHHLDLIESWQAILDTADEDEVKEAAKHEHLAMALIEKAYPHQFEK